MIRNTLLLTIFLALAVRAAAAPIPPSDIVRFADSFTFYDPAGRAETNNNPSNAIGPADGDTVSLGDLTSAELAAGRSPGVIILEFDFAIFDGPGADLAVFENAFDFTLSGFPPEFVFAELAFVEVSSNGVDFARFPSISLNVPNDGDNSDFATDPEELITPFGSGFAGVNKTFI
ncbi:MAG: hypothetical protein AAGG46_07560, partial [Planctomycetota bacterium]